MSYYFKIKPEVSYQFVTCPTAKVLSRVLNSVDSAITDEVADIVTFRAEIFRIGSPTIYCPFIDIPKATISSDSIVTIYYSVKVSLYPYNKGIGNGISVKSLTAIVRYDSRLSFEVFYEKALAAVKESARGNAEFQATFWSGSNKIVSAEESFTEECLKAKSFILYWRLEHLPYSKRLFNSIADKVPTVNGISCANMTDEKLFDLIDRMDSSAFTAAVKAYVHKHKESEDWRNQIQIGYNFLLSVQKSLRDAFLSEACRRLMLNVVITTACVICGAYQKPEHALWSEDAFMAGNIPSNLLGHGPLDFWVEKAPCYVPTTTDAIGVEDTEGNNSSTSSSSANSCSKRLRLHGGFSNVVQVVSEPDDDDDEDEDEDEDEEVSTVENRKTVRKSMGRLVSQGLDSLLEGAGDEDRKEAVAHKRALVTSTSRCLTVTTGQRFFHFCLDWADSSQPAKLVYFGQLPLHILPLSEIDNEPVEKEEFEVVVAALCMVCETGLKDAPIAKKL